MYQKQRTKMFVLLVLFLATPEAVLADWKDGNGKCLWNTQGFWLENPASDAQNPDKTYRFLLDCKNNYMPQ